MRTMLVAGVLLLLLAPAAALLSAAALLNPAAQASCLPTGPAAGTATGTPNPGATPSTPVGETSRVVFPLPAGTWVLTSGFGMRTHPITGVRALHPGLDLAAPSGTPIFAAADGRVVFAGPSAGYGNLIMIEHTVAGQLVVTRYAHMTAASIRVKTGDTVSAGQPIAAVGAEGYATGPHLQFEVRPGGRDAAPIDPTPWLAARGAIDLNTGTDTGAETGSAGCGGPDGTATPFNGTDPSQLVDDPTSNGKITARTAAILAQIRSRFPATAWACWSPRPGTTSEHPLGRACDGTLGNAIGVAATGPALTLGWQLANWLKTNAETLGVEYVIWQAKIWSLARTSEGWRPYDGGGMYNPASVTGGHYDHVHFTSKPNTVPSVQSLVTAPSWRGGRPLTSRQIGGVRRSAFWADTYVA
ncbi:hypothetical protein GCM10027062_30460 [Nocardioides hungaricus]